MGHIAFDHYPDTHQAWQYERGRLFAIACRCLRQRVPPLPLHLWARRKNFASALAMVRALLQDGTLL
jgi:hypothetical protein